MRTLVLLALAGLLEVGHAQQRSWDSIQSEHRDSMARLQSYMDCAYGNLKIAMPTINVANAEASVDSILSQCASMAEAVVEGNLKSGEDRVRAAAEFRREQRHMFLVSLGIIPERGTCAPGESQIIALAAACKSRFPNNKFDFPVRPLVCRNSDVEAEVAAKAMLLDDASFEKECASSAGLARVGRMSALPYRSE